MTTQPELEGAIARAGEMENQAPSEAVSPCLTKDMLQGDPALQTSGHGLFLSLTGT